MSSNNSFPSDIRSETDMIKNQAMLSLAIREQGIKDGTRSDGCPIWDEMSKNLWMRIINGEVGVDTYEKESISVMDHCKTCNHPMCKKA